MMQEETNAASSLRSLGHLDLAISRSSPYSTISKDNKSRPLGDSTNFSQGHASTKRKLGGSRGNLAALLRNMKSDVLEEGEQQEKVVNLAPVEPGTRVLPQIPKVQASSFSSDEELQQRTKKYKTFLVPVSSYGHGIGISVAGNSKKNGLLVAAVAFSGPSDEKIFTGDIIIKVNDVDVRGLEKRKAMEVLKNEINGNNNNVLITLLREANDEEDDHEEQTKQLTDHKETIQKPHEDSTTFGFNESVTAPETKPQGTEEQVAVGDNSSKLEGGLKVEKDDGEGTEDRTAIYEEPPSLPPPPANYHDETIPPPLPPPPVFTSENEGQDADKTQSAQSEFKLSKEEIFSAANAIEAESTAPGTRAKKTVSVHFPSTPTMPHYRPNDSSVREVSSQNIVAHLETVLTPDKVASSHQIVEEFHDITFQPFGGDYEVLPSTSFDEKHSGLFPMQFTSTPIQSRPDSRLGNMANSLIVPDGPSNRRPNTSSPLAFSTSTPLGKNGNFEPNDTDVTPKFQSIHTERQAQGSEGVEDVFANMQQQTASNLRAVWAQDIASASTPQRPFTSSPFIPASIRKGPEEKTKVMHQNTMDPQIITRLRNIQSVLNAAYDFSQRELMRIKEELGLKGVHSISEVRNIVDLDFQKSEEFLQLVSFWDTNEVDRQRHYKLQAANGVHLETQQSNLLSNVSSTNDHVNGHHHHHHHHAHRHRSHHGQHPLSNPLVAEDAVVLRRSKTVSSAQGQNNYRVSAFLDPENILPPAHHQYFQSTVQKNSEVAKPEPPSAPFRERSKSIDEAIHQKPILGSTSATTVGSSGSQNGKDYIFHLYMGKDIKSLGINISGSSKRGEDLGIFVDSVELTCPTNSRMLRKFDRIIEINGESLFNRTNQEATGVIKSKLLAGGPITLGILRRLTKEEEAMAAKPLAPSKSINSQSEDAPNHMPLERRRSWRKTARRFNEDEYRMQIKSQLGPVLDWV